MSDNFHNVPYSNIVISLQQNAMEKKNIVTRRWKTHILQRENIKKEVNKDIFISKTAACITLSFLFNFF